VDVAREGIRYERQRLGRFAAAFHTTIAPSVRRRDGRFRSRAFVNFTDSRTTLPTARPTSTILFPVVASRRQEADGSTGRIRSRA
jgi:hypothetical protein